MLQEISMRREVVVQPPGLRAKGGYIPALVRQLLSDLADLKCSSEHGYYISPTSIGTVSEGRLREGSGAVYFTVEFKCLVFRIVKNEVVDLEVVKVSRSGAEAKCGPFSIFLHRMFMSDFDFVPSESGDHSFQYSQEVIRAGSVVRARIHTKPMMKELERELVAMASLEGDHLRVVLEEEL